MFFLHGMAEFSTTLVLFFALNAYHKLNPPQTVAVYLATPGESQTATQACHGQGQDGEGAEWCGVCSNAT